MRNIPKVPVPQVLLDNKPDWDAKLAANQSDHNKNRYRHQEIKATLLAETESKCVYCESKIGHNCPGDIEHKCPKAKRIDLIFDWSNLTIACAECNRRKLEYYDPACMFLDPYVDDVESLTMHVGPLVFNVPGNVRAELTIKLLELDHFDKRRQLIERKVEKLEEIRNLVERACGATNPILREFIVEDLIGRSSRSNEFSGMVKAYLNGLPPGFL